MIDELDILKELNFEEHEAKTYLALLELSEATATLISKRTGIGRVHTYQILDNLIGKGLASHVLKNNVKYFSPAPPDILLKNVREKEKNLREILPKLKARQKRVKQDTKVDVYKGREGIKTILKDIINTKEDFVAFGEEGRFQDVLPIDIEKFLNEMVRNKIHEKVLVNEKLKGKTVKSKNSEFKFLPNEYLTKTTTVVYKNKIANFIWTDPYYVILIENKEVANSYRGYFNTLWKIAKK